MGMFDWLFGKGSESALPVGVPVPAVEPDRMPVAPRQPAYAVVDVETTGLSPQHNRVVELAIVRVDSRGDVVDEWSTRFDPEGPVGATHIHGITQSDVVGAPLFRDIAASLIPQIAGLPIAAHNASFDLAFLRAEFQRAGWEAPWIPSFCTLGGSRDYLPQLDRRRLADCCWAAGVPLENAHSALGDARATAGLLRFYLSRAGRREGRGWSALQDDARSAVWPTGPTHPPFASFPDEPTSQRARPQRFTPTQPKQPPLRQQLTDLSLLEAVEEGAPEGVVAYLETLLEALEDGEITEEEAGQLGDLISVYALTTEDLHAAHRAFILALAHRAVDDGRVSTNERAELHALSDALDVPREVVNALIAHADEARAARMSAGLSPLPDSWNLGVPLRVGDKVAFTGCEERQRDRLERRAAELGVRVMNNVSRLTAMLVTDGSMDGTKLAKAKEVGTRIVHPDTFEILLTHLQPSISTQAHSRPARSSPSAPLPESRNSVVPASDPSTPATPTVVRSWAIANGYVVGVRGRISRDIWDAFSAAHPAGAPTSPGQKDARTESFEFQGESMAPLGEWAYAPIIPTQAMALTGGDDIEVNRTGRYQAGVRLALDKWDFEAEPTLMALLVAEPLNPTIEHAVRVDLLVSGGRTVAGYLPDETSEVFHELVKSAMDIGALPVMDAHAAESTATQSSVYIRLVHIADDPARTSVTEEMISRTHDRLANEKPRHISGAR